MKNVYISYLGSHDYLLGLLALYYSWKKTNSENDFFVLLSENINEKVELNINSIGIKTIRAKLDLSFSETTQAENEIFNVERWNNTLLKLKIFEFVQFSKIIFLDADMMVLRNLDHLFQYPHMTATNAGFLYPGNEDWIELNSGLMVIEPQLGIFNEMLSLIPRVAAKRKYFGDQNIINEFYPNWIDKKDCQLSEGYNVFSSYLKYYIYTLGFNLESTDDKKALAVIHFIGYPKPWMYRDNYLLFIIRVFKKYIFKLLNIKADKLIKIEYKLLIRKCRKKIKKWNV